MTNKYLKPLKKYFSSMVKSLRTDPNEVVKKVIGFGTNRYHPDPNFVPDPPRPEEEIAAWFMEKPDESDEIEQEKTIHEKMYEIATAKYNPFAIGGSDNFQGGSENVQQ